METVSASLDIEVFVSCPKCDYMIDLLRPSDTNNEDLNEDGFILRQACPDGLWIDEHEKFKVEKVTCSNCKAEFRIEGLEW